MSSVTQRIGEIKQPKGGYIKPSQFESKILNDNETLHETENIHASVVEMAVDYLTRLVMCASVNDAFRISLWGAECATNWIPNAIDIGHNLAENIKGIDDQSIINACKLVTFDVWYRNTGAALMAFNNSNSTNPKIPDIYTIKNIQIMVQRGINFFKKYGPIVKDGFEFNEKAFTSTVGAGDGDFLTVDTMWDFKVSKTKPTSKHTLQLLMYWIMGQHSGEKEFKNITNLGIFNPRLNTVYTLPISKIARETIKTVEKEVIGY